MSVPWSLIGPALLGAIFLGISCGLLGSFLVVRRLSLLGDTLSHSVLPGIALGFLVASGRNMPLLLLGALLAGLLSVWLVSLLKHTTKLKEDALLGLVLTGFYSLGAVLFTWIQQLPLSGKGGLNAFLFGQAAALNPNDLWWLGSLTLITVLFVVLFYKELLVTAFDPVFAKVSGFPPAVVYPLLMTFVAIAVVIALEKVGIVLVSALLILPPVTARLHTHYFPRLLLLSVVVATLSAISGVLISVSTPRLALGPLIVLSAASLLVLSLLFSQRYGLIQRMLKKSLRRQRIRRENTLKWVYQAGESLQTERPVLSLGQVANRANRSIDQVERALETLQRHKLIHWEETPHKTFAGQRSLSLTGPGWKEAQRIIRNHRLWELYLTNRAAFLTDHVHESAEAMEHELPDEIVERLSEILDHPETDPHGKPIPRAEEAS